MRYLSISQSEIVIINIKVKGRGNMRLKDIREDRDYTQSHIADVLHIKQNTYSQYETGVRQIPIDLLIKLADFYNVSTDYILERTDNPKIAF